MEKTERKEKERAGWKKVRTFALFSLAALIADLIIAILFWEWDGILYIIWGVWAVVGIYGALLKRKLDGRL